jgi:hypothetical protein
MGVSLTAANWAIADVTLEIQGAGLEVRQVGLVALCCDSSQTTRWTFDPGLSVWGAQAVRQEIGDSAGGDMAVYLHEAALSGDVADVRRLVAAGADLEEQYDVDGWRPLHVAAAMGMLEVVTVLVELGADKEAKEANGWRPLHMAAGNGHVETMTVLVQLGANKEAKG